MNISTVGQGKVILIAGGGQVYTDLAARFVKSERSLADLLASPYNKDLVRNIINSGHGAATEFDYFLFGIEGYSRVTEVQLVRKRLASYMIKSGKYNKEGARSFDMVIPENLKPLTYTWRGNTFSTWDLLEMIECFYNQNAAEGVPEHDLRYMKPQATEFKALIGMNAHALLDWFKIRCCMNASEEMRDLAYKMLKLCKEAAPDLFEEAGPNCKWLGCCPENKYQNPACKGKIDTLEDFKKLNNFMRPR